MSSNYVKVFDTTLRDGEQSPGASLTSPSVYTLLCLKGAGWMQVQTMLYTNAPAQEADAVQLGGGAHSHHPGPFGVRRALQRALAR